MKAMILAAGKGTRMLPLTVHMPKALIEIQGISLLENAIRYLKYYGIEDIVINVHHCAVQIMDFISRNKSFGIRIEFSDESAELLDTGGGLYKARWFFTDGEPFVLMSSDIITNLNLWDMLEYHKATAPLATLAVKHRESTRHFLFDREYRLCGWQNNLTGELRQVREVVDPVRLAFSTVHIIEPALFDLITETEPFSITDLYLRLAGEHTIRGFEHDHSDWFECGRIENLPHLNQSAAIKTIYHKYHLS